MADVGEDQQQPRRAERQDHRSGGQAKPRQRHAGQKGGKAGADEQKAPGVEGPSFLGADIGDQDRDQPHTQHGQRHVDPEDPAPVPIGRQIAAKGRADHRADQGGHGQPGQRLYHAIAGHGAQQDQPPHRHHHRPADALQHTRRHQLAQALRQTAGHRPQREHRNRPAKHRARTIAVGHPARGRDEHRERQKIGGQHQLQMNGVRRKIPRDIRQRRGQHRGVDILHQEGDGDDQGNGFGGGGRAHAATFPQPPIRRKARCSGGVRGSSHRPAGSAPGER